MKNRLLVVIALVLAEIKMKKTLTLAFFTLVVTFVFFAVSSKYLRGTKMGYDVRVSYWLTDSDLDHLDPAKINSFYQSVLLLNIYSRLVEYDNNGNFQSGIAKKFYWNENELVFEFGEKSKTKAGHYIDAEDAAVSIRRILKLGSSTHTDLSYFLCGDTKNIDIFKNCEAVSVKNNKLIIKISSPKYKPFVISTLAAGEFAIIPKASIDVDTLKIRDFSNTSGPYFVESTGENWILKNNPEHYKIKETSPTKVILVPLGRKEAYDQFLDNDVDVVTTANNLPARVFVDLKSKVPNFSISKTLPIKLYLLQFSLKALEETTVRQRFYIAAKFKEIMAAKYPLPILSEKADEFFLVNGHGHISEGQRLVLDSMSKSVQKDNFKKKVSFYLYKELKDILQIFDSIEELNMVETNDFPFNQAIEDRLDLSFITTDTSYQEDLTLIEYNFNQATFGYGKKQAKEWLSAYIEDTDKVSRSKRIQNLQYEALKNGVIFPLFKNPYTAIGRNGYSVNLSPISSSTQFWEIEKDESNLSRVDKK